MIGTHAECNIRNACEMIEFFRLELPAPINVLYWLKLSSSANLFLNSVFNIG